MRPLLRAGLEAALSNAPGVAHVAVVGRPDEHGGETVAAFPHRHGFGADRYRKVRAHCRERLARYKVLDTFEIIDEMPLNARGKITRAAPRRRPGRR